MNYRTWIIEGLSYRDQQAHLKGKTSDKPWLSMFMDSDAMDLRCGSLNSPFRLKPIPFDDCVSDRFFFIGDSPDAPLLGGALTVRVNWNGSAADLPEGWEDTVRRSYLDRKKKGMNYCNTLVGMQVFTLSQYRNNGLAGRFLDEMIKHARSLGLRKVIIPALLPSQFEREHAALDFEKLSRLTRDDGLPADHWLRLHVRKGAIILSHQPRSHGFAMCLRDFSRYISSYVPQTSGTHLAPLDKDISFGVNASNIWQKIHVRLEDDLVLFYWGCVWVVYDL